MKIRSCLTGIALTFIMQHLIASEADPTLAARQQIEADLIAQYQAQQTQPQIVEKIDFLDRDGSKQPISIVYNRDLIDNNRVLVIAMDDNARVLVTEVEDAVIIGVPMADRVRDLVPATSEDVREGTPEWENAQITDPNSEAMIRFIRDSLIPYAEENYGPFFHKVLFGYSLGGIFTLQTLMTEPQLFDSYIAGSPSLWYRYNYYEDITIAASKNRDRFAGKCLILSAGEDEPSISVGTRNFERLLTGLDMPLITHHQRNMETDHGHNRTLSFLYGWDRIFNTDDVFVPRSTLTATTVSEFHDFMDGWLDKTSCVANSPMRSVSAYSLFATKLVADKNYEEMRTLLAYAREAMPPKSRSFAAIQLSLLSDFVNMPADEKKFWANSYSEFLSSGPTPSLAIHYLNKDVIEYLATK